MSFFYDYPDNWSVETTHDIDIDQPCHDAIEPTIAFATTEGVGSHQHSFMDAEGTRHAVTVRKQELPPEDEQP
jgi:hypothetical protein